jgi:hypothetical protein
MNKIIEKIKAFTSSLKERFASKSGVIGATVTILAVLGIDVSIDQVNSFLDAVSVATDNLTNLATIGLGLYETFRLEIKEAIASVKKGK